MADNRAKPTVPKRPTPSGDGGPDLAKKFMRENPPGKLADPVEQRPEVAPSFPEANAPQTLFEQDHPATPAEPVAHADVPAAPAATVDYDGTPIATGGETAPTVEAPPAEGAAPVVEGETPATETPQATAPTAEVKPAETPAAPAEAAKPQAAAPTEPSYAPDEKIALVPGSEPWTREQIVARLQQSFTELEPKAKEAEQFRSLLGGDYADAETRWKPVLERLAANPQRTQLLENLLATDDPGLLDYLQRSVEFYRTEIPATGASTPGQPAQVAQLADDPRIARAESIARQMEGQLAVMRANNEKAQVYMQYPFLQHNEKARQAIFARATEMYAADEAAGKPLNERRGLLDAVRAEQVFLDTMGIASRQAATAHPAAIEPKPGVGAAALLPGTGPGALGTTRQAPPREYTGPPENAKAAFLHDYPE
jgi:hypothetical protein